ncbi:hypothetical protein B6S44_14655 [Bosea sp. Tri-44]|nr:hypothetical protein B6S44_14655 [Bosea sp. Tri-44]
MLLKGIHADVLADKLQVTNAVIEPDLFDPADFNATLASPLIQSLNLNTLDKAASPDRRPVRNRPEIALVVIEVRQIGLGLFNKATQDPIGINAEGQRQMVSATS